MEIESYLAALASATPIPAGGSAATIVAAAGSSLVAMVARIVAANPAYASHHALANELAGRADDLRRRSLRARTHDERAFGSVVAALALPKNSPDERALRTTAVQRGFAEAAAAPLEAAEIATLVAALADRALAFENASTICDLGTAAEFAQAAFASAAYNVRGNHTHMKDRRTIEEHEGCLATYEGAIARSVERVRFEVNRSFALTPP